jgi:glutamate synthase (NADPH/NADH) large chain
MKLIKGLYDYREEHDACGIGFYANMDNKRSHDIIDKCISVIIPAPSPVMPSAPTPPL